MKLFSKGHSLSLSQTWECLQKARLWPLAFFLSFCLGLLFLGQTMLACIGLAAATVLLFLIEIYLIFAVKKASPDETHLPKAIHRRIESMGKIAAGMAHEINGPLTVISGRVFRMNKNLKSIDPFCRSSNISSLKRDIKKINANIESISQLVQKIVSYIRGQGEFRIDAFTLQELKDALAREVSVIFKQLSFEFIIPPNLNLSQCMVQGHLHLIQRVMLSVMENGVRLNKTSHPWIELKLETKSKNQNPYFQMAMTFSGENLDSVLAEKLFDPFFRSTSLGKKEVLNLGVCRSMTRQHGGDLFHNSDHQHPQFVLTLPFISLDDE